MPPTVVKCAIEAYCEKSEGPTGPLAELSMRRREIFVAKCFPHSFAFPRSFSTLDGPTSLGDFPTIFQDFPDRYMHSFMRYQV